MPPRWRDTDVRSQVTFHTGLGFIIPGAALAGAVLGWLLDRTLHTSPALTLVCMLAGVAGGIFEILQILARNEKKQASDARLPTEGNGNRTDEWQKETL